MDNIVDQFLTYVNKRDSESLPTCSTENDYNNGDNLRILAVFMILISSGLGSFFPILSSKYAFIRMPDWCFFIAKFFGSGVIVATAFVHLLEPASDALGNECLGGTFAEYPWAFGICLMSLFALFFTEIITHYYGMIAYNDENESDDLITKDSNSSIDTVNEHLSFNKDDVEAHPPSNKLSAQKPSSVLPGSNHYSHAANHQDPSQLDTPLEQTDKENYASQILAVSILEFGIIFHSVFVGLSLAVAGDEFNTLFIVLIFHQMFEGLGLGARLAETRWPSDKHYIPWLMALGFTITTPIGIAIGIGVKHSFIPGSRTALIANGVLDAISAGILIYTGLVELMAHEFLFSNQFKGEHGFRLMLSAYLIMCLGAGLMALLGKWA